MGNMPTSYKVEVVDKTAQPACGITGTCAWNELPVEIRRRLHILEERLADAPELSERTPFVLYLDPSDEGPELVVGFVLSGPTSAPGVNMIMLPGGKVAKVVHRGAYSDLGQAHDALFDWARKNGYQPHGGSWELYVGKESDGDEPATEVYLPLNEAANGPMKH